MLGVSKAINPRDYFSLDVKFLKQYEAKKPNFGFNGLGELVFFRTYSRLKPDGSKESFFDCIKRVVEGCYEIQRRHCVSLHIPWNFKKAQESAQEMFQRMWDFKFLPPGRGLWMMGTDFMWSRLGAALNNCFDGKTEIITRDGVKQIGLLVGTEQELLTTGGKWVKAPIKSFGVQELYKLTLERAGVQKIIYTTAGHRWFAKDLRKTQTVAIEDTSGVIVKKRQHIGYKEVTTVNLTEHHMMQSVYGSGVNGNVRPSAFGVAHGIAYGDGTTGQDSESCGTYLYLCEHKNEELLEYFPNCPTSFDKEKGVEGAVRVADLPRFFRRKPSLRESKSYLYGWLAGYFAADGTINTKGNQIYIASSEYDNMLLVRDVCAVLGIGTNSIVQTTQTVTHDGIKKKFIGYKIGIMPIHLNEDFFLLSEHKKRFLDHRSHRDRPLYKWHVKSVEQTGEFAEVYCPQVPDTQAFALADNILTGNCAFISTDDTIEADPAEPFCFLMDMAMLGVGVGFDTKGKDRIAIKNPSAKTVGYQIEDSREGWVESLRMLLHSYTLKYKDGKVKFDYSLIRPKGSPINGFGGTAAGSGILVELHNAVIALLDSRVGKKLSSVDITDIMNIIGKCVVAGNVRRCLPKGTLVHLKRGLTPIEQVRVGDLVLTADGYYPVIENVKQGVQRVVTIKNQMGKFRCTDRHRIAIMSGVGKYEWKRAKELVKDDRMVFVDAIIPGVTTALPSDTDASTRGNQMIVPNLTTDVAWFIGAIHGDGYVYDGRAYKGRKHHGSSVSISVNRDEYHDGMIEKISTGFAMFGFTAREQSSHDNSHKLRVTSRKLASYFHKNLKTAKTPLDVPEFILCGMPEIRAAYLAGLLDTDGSTKNRPTVLLASVYAKFIKQVQAVYSSLGIPTKCVLRAEEDGTNQAKWELHLVGEMAISKFNELVQQYAVKQLRVMTGYSGHDYGFPSAWVDKSTIDYGRSWSPQQAQMSYNRACLCDAETNDLVPIAVEAVIDESIEVETYDLSVPGRNEFVAEGMLVHNTAEIAFGSPDDTEYSNMKNVTAGLTETERNEFFNVTNGLYSKSRSHATIDDFTGTTISADKLNRAIETWNALNSYRWASNNSVSAEVGMDYSKFGEQIAANGEPGFIWLQNMRDYGRMKDGHTPGIDGRVAGSNPCVEQSLESSELCCLVETFPARHDDAADFMRTLKFAYLYAKTVTLLPTHNVRTNQVMLRNRRIGLSQSGIVQAFAKFGRRAVLRDFCDAGYSEIDSWDMIYSEWLCVPKSIKKTSIKPSGSVSLLAGATPGIHYPEATTYWRTVRVAKDNILVKILQKAGYRVEPSVTDSRTMVVYFAISDRSVKAVNEVSMLEQLENCAAYQHYWADNQVSCTVKFKKHEAKDIASALELYEDQLKGISFLPYFEHNYPQAPYIPCAPQEVDEYNSSIKEVDYTDYIMEAAGSNYCENDTCELKTETAAQ